MLKAKYADQTHALGMLPRYFGVLVWLFLFHPNSNRTACTLFRHATHATVYSAQPYWSYRETELVCDVYGMHVPYALNGCFAVEVGTGHIQVKYGQSWGPVIQSATLKSKTGYREIRWSPSNRDWKPAAVNWARLHTIMLNVTHHTCQNKATLSLKIFSHTNRPGLLMWIDGSTPIAIRTQTYAAERDSRSWVACHLGKTYYGVAFFIVLKYFNTCIRGGGLAVWPRIWVTASWEGAQEYWDYKNSDEGKQNKWETLQP